jgi:uncharacterized protein (TIGR02145 family)
LTPSGIINVDCSSGGGAPIPPAFVCGDTVDYGGQIYNTVLIGSQCWFKENLNVGTKTNSGSSEPTCREVPSGWGMWSCQIATSTVEKYCYDNLDSNCATYGGLYEWPEMMGFSYLCNYADFSSGSSNCGSGTTYTINSVHQGICPTGWHIPSDPDWHILELGLANPSNETNCNGGLLEGATCSPAGIKLRASVSDAPPWNGDNASGFKVLPAGVRQSDGSFIEKNSTAYFWSASTINSGMALARSHYAAQWGVYRGEGWRIGGWSVRCVKN